MTANTTARPDTVDELAAIAPGSRLDELRRRRPVTREQVQASFDALFSPLDDTEISLTERWLIAAFASALAGDTSSSRFYAEQAERADATAASLVGALAASAAASGPYGAYSEVDLQSENTAGLVFTVGAEGDTLGARLTSAIEHTHLLVFRPRESSADALDTLRAAGWSVDGIVTLSQLVAFLSFQQRVVEGLRVLAEEAAA